MDAAKTVLTRLLLVDDDPNMLDFLKEHLVEKGYWVETAHSGGEAVQKVRERRYDIALMDVRMPLMDGIACLENVKVLDPMMQVIMLSGEATLREAVSAMRNGAYHFLEKPVPMASLLFHIEKAREKRRLDTLAEAVRSGKAVVDTGKMGPSANAAAFRILESKMEELQKAYDALEESKNLIWQKEKLAALGQMAAEIAHEIASPLTAMIGYSDMLLESKDISEEAREQIRIILDESLRCHALAQDVLSNAKRRKPELVPLNLKNLVEETLKTLAVEIRKNNVKVALEFPPVMPSVPGDAPQLKQVLINILKNAMQAMERQTDRKIDIACRFFDGRVRLEIADNGPGFRPEEMHKLFRSFYTSRESTGGTGLGLTISDEIVHEHGGRLLAEPNPYSRGALFTIELPLGPSAMAA